MLSVSVCPKHNFKQINDRKINEILNASYYEQFNGMLSLGWLIIKEFEYIHYMSLNGSFHTHFKNLAIQAGLITSTLILSTIMDHKSLLVVIVWTGLLLTQWNILHSLMCGVIQSIFIENHDCSNYMSSYKNYGTIPHLGSNPFVFCITHVCNSLYIQ